MSASPEPRRLGGSTLAAALFARLQDSLLPARRMLSRAVLVYEERHFREVAVTSVYAALSAEAAKVRDELRSLEERIILRADIVMEELWRRTEAAGARQATELQRLAGRVGELQQAAAEQAPDLARLATQMSEVHRLASEVAEIRRRATASPAGLQNDPLLAELERGLPGPAGPRLEPYLKYFEHLSPVVDLRPGSGEFLRLAATTGVDAYGVSPAVGPGDDPEDGQGGSDPGIAHDLVAALQHLRSVAPGSLGGAFASHLVDGLPDASATELLAAIGAALKPDGIAVVESANPASFARCLASLGHPETVPFRPPEELAALATSAGLEVDECRYAAFPSRHLGGVSPDFTDPVLQEVAEGINGMVAQLNDVL